MEENNLSENTIIINQVIPKEKNINVWAFFIPIIQIFGCGFFLVTALNMCGFPDGPSGSNCSLGYKVGLIGAIIFFGFPIFILIFSFFKSKFNNKKMVFPTASFIISSILPLLVLGFFLANISFNK